MMVMRRQILRWAGGALAAGVASRAAHGQAYPSRPVRVIVTTGPGGQGDTTARLVAATSNIVTNISLYPKIAYDPYRDFDPISQMCASPHVLVVHPSIPAATVNDLVALAKASPGKFSYASAGRGTPAHLAGELFKLAFDVDITHVPFNGGGPASASTLGGHVPIAVSALPTAVTYIRGGQLRALGMFSSKRSSALPDVPSMMEATG